MYREKQPSKESIGKLENVKVIYYDKEIRQWLERCINKLTDKQIVLKEIIKQYLMLINKMTNNDILVEERKKLKKQIAENWESAKYLIDNFKHIKWHTVDNFWNELKIKLENKYKNVTFFPEDNIIDVIGDITHNNKDINHGILFNIDDEIQIYISSLRGLSWGIVDPKKWIYFKDEKLKDIYFFNFVTENTFRLIDESYLKVIINQIIKEIDDEKDNLFKNLKE